jgi:RNA polymerase sigma-70 factor, ECF subfamily
MTPTAASLEEHRAAVTGHCYRMLGSAFDAEDAVQETMLRAWRHLDRFEGRASIKTWLYRIATNVCLDALSRKSRRARPVDDGPVGTVDAPLVERPRTHWLEPIPDERVLPAGASPSELAILRESVRLAFVAALQQLTPRQRAALLLTERFPLVGRRGRREPRVLGRCREPRSPPRSRDFCRRTSSPPRRRP